MKNKINYNYKTLFKFKREKQTKINFITQNKRKSRKMIYDEHCICVKHNEQMKRQN